MTNEELKKKIVEILEETEYEWTEEKNGYILQIFYDKLADALIAAGIGDVSELKKHRVIVETSPILTEDGCCLIPNTPPTVKQLYSGEEVEKIVKEREEYKHRAEVAEKAGRIIQRDMARVFDVSNPRICELIANIWDLAKKQAEKELAEEKR